MNVADNPRMFATKFLTHRFGGTLIYWRGGFYRLTSSAWQQVPMKLLRARVSKFYFRCKRAPSVKLSYMDELVDAVRVAAEDRVRALQVAKFCLDSAQDSGCPLDARKH